MVKIQIAPSILSADFLHLGEDIQKIQDGGADWVHIDVMDGHFVPNLSIGVPIIQAVKKGVDLPLDVHLMIGHPHTFIDPFLEAGSDSITFHIEASHNPLELIKYIKKSNCQVAIALKPKTPIEQIESLLDHLDMVLVMTVEPGFGGQKFMDDMVDKIYTLRHLWHWKGDIQVDGGITEKTAPICASAGANVFVAGSAIFGDSNPGLALKKIRQACL